MILNIDWVKRNMKILALFITCVFLLFACSPSYKSVEDKQFKNSLDSLVRKADLKLDNGEKILFRIDTITKFKWDRMYIIPGNVLKKDIEKRIGAPWEFDGGMGILTEENILFVFMREDTIVSTVRFVDGDPNYSQFRIEGQDDNFIPISNPKLYFYKRGNSVVIFPVNFKLDNSDWRNKLREVPLN